MKNIWKAVIIVVVLVLIIFGVWMLMDKKVLSKEEVIQNVDVIEENNNKISYATTFEDNVGVEILGDAEFFSSFETDKIGISGHKAGTSVTLIPAPDFIDNQVYHYYDDGTLALYVSVSNTVGGQVKYYFYQDKLVETKNELAEPGLNPQLLDENDILTRAKLVYEKYMK